MFTGIVRDQGAVIEARLSSAGALLRVRSALFENAAEGDSVCVSGVCLTVTERSEDIAAFDVVQETLRKTTLGERRAGDSVNLERSLALGDLLHGHLVQGHVDGVGEVKELRPEGASMKLTVSLPPEIRPYLISKGSIAFDGVSLTIGEVSAGACSVYLVPHTLELTTLKSLRAGSRVNVEADCIAKYLAQLAAPYRSA